MGLVARNPEQMLKEQGSGALGDAPPLYASGTVHHDSVQPDGSVLHHRQRFDSGELVEWTLVDEPGPWALVRAGEPGAPCPVQRTTPEALELIGVRLGTERYDLPPLDDFADPGWNDLERVPDATARLRFELTGSPAGRILCDIRYQDGIRPMHRVVAGWPERTEEGEPAHDAPEMSVRMTFRNYLRMRAGEISSLEAIEDGGDVGDTRWTLLLLLHGLVQSEPYVAVHRRLPVIPAELRWWGEAAPFVPADSEPLALPPRG